MHVFADAVHKSSGVAAVAGQGGTVEVRERLADRDGDDDDGDQDGRVEAGRNVKREDIIVVEDKGDDAVEDGDAGLAAGC